MLKELSGAELLAARLHEEELHNEETRTVIRQHHAIEKELMLNALLEQQSPASSILRSCGIKCLVIDGKVAQNGSYGLYGPYVAFSRNEIRREELAKAFGLNLEKFTDRLRLAWRAHKTYTLIKYPFDPGRLYSPNWYINITFRKNSGVYQICSFEDSDFSDDGP